MSLTLSESGQSNTSTCARGLLLSRDSDLTRREHTHTRPGLTCCQLVADSPLTFGTAPRPGESCTQPFLAAKSLKSDPQLSNREPERRTGASRNTVGRVREEMETSGQLSQSDSRLSADGRVRPASQSKREPAPGIAFDGVGEQLLDC